jgi:hypothetical protein
MHERAKKYRLICKFCFPDWDGKERISVKTVTKQVGDRQFMFKERKKLSNRRNDDSLILDLDRGEWICTKLYASKCNGRKPRFETITALVP